MLKGQTAATPAYRDDLTVNEVTLAFLRFAEQQYRDGNGKPTLELPKLKNTFRVLFELYGDALAKDFGPIALKALRQEMIRADLCRTVVNSRIGQIKRLFKWAASEQLIPPTVYHGLLCVEGVRRGQAGAREADPVRPVADADVDAVLPFLCPTLRAMVQLQRLTGMRSGELVTMRGVDLDTAGEIWFYAPSDHKTAHHGHRRVIPIGPQGKDVLRPFLRPDVQAFLFSPRQARAERDTAKRAARKSKVQPSQRDRARARPRRAPGARYTTNSYCAAVKYGIEKARAAGLKVNDWHPYQLRHSAATRVRRERGLDAARAVLGQKSLAIADTYAELDSALASSVAAQLG